MPEDLWKSALDTAGNFSSDEMHSQLQPFNIFNLKTSRVLQNADDAAVTEIVRDLFLLTIMLTRLKNEGSEARGPLYTLPPITCSGATPFACRACRAY